MGRGSELMEGGARFAREPGFTARLMAPGFKTLLNRIDAGLKTGSLKAHLPDGTVRLFGGCAPGIEASVTVHDWRALIRLASNGSIGCYQGWEAREWDSPDPVALFALFVANAQSLGDAARAKGGFRWAARLAHALNRNSRQGSTRNIRAHYDLGNDFYSAWLDPTMSYSSAIWREGDNLESAQNRKMAALQNRLGNPQTVLEIGCGWGALADRFASTGAQVTAVSLSDEQLQWAEAHYDPSVTFCKQDYRDLDGQYDAIVSVEMVEAVGRVYWPAYFDCLARCLKPGGRAAIQFISIRDDMFDAYANSADFIQAYIFPGGLLVRTSDFRQLAEARGLHWHDEYNFGADYARTLAQWRQNFNTAVAENRLPSGFDRHFYRLWEFYLIYCEGGFRGGGIDVHQVTLEKC